MPAINCRRRRPVPLSPEADLGLALATIGSFQNSIQHADTKTIAVSGLHGGLTALAVGQIGSARLPEAGRPLLIVVMAVLAALFAVASAFSAWHLADALRPRLDGPDDANRFGFPSLATSASVPPPATAARQREEAWQQALALARIAFAKHRRIQRSLPWTALAVGSALTWLVLAELTTPNLAG